MTGAIEHGLSERQIEILRRLLAPYADRIEAAGLFGSRAAGAARPDSDIDLVLYGDIGDAEIDRIWTLFDESALPVGVDLVAYDRIDRPGLRERIDRTMRPLFSQADLKDAARRSA